MHLNTVLHHTVTQAPLSFDLAKGHLFNIRVRGGSGEAGTTLLRTAYGPMRLYLGQICETTREDSGLYTLHTRNYRYALSIPNVQEPLLRWEYLRDRGEAGVYCRHHLQGPIALDLYHQRSREQVNLQAWHLPTGWVPIEEVLRFCIVDLGVTPLSEDWDRILIDSERRFRAEFSSPGQ